MSHEPEHDHTLKALEAALANLAPAGAKLNRDRIFFEVGRTSARHGRLTPLLLLLTSAAGIGVATLWYCTPPTFVERVVYVPVQHSPVLATDRSEDPDKPHELSWISLTENWLKQSTPRRHISLFEEEDPPDREFTTAGQPVTSRFNAGKQPSLLLLPWSTRP